MPPICARHVQTFVKLVQLNAKNMHTWLTAKNVRKLVASALKSAKACLKWPLKKTLPFWFPGQDPGT